MSESIDYIRLPGSSRRYYVKGTGEEISRREYIRRTEGVTPEEKAIRRVEEGKAKPGITYRKYVKRQRRKKPTGLEKIEPVIQDPIDDRLYTHDGINIRKMPTKGERGVTQLVGYYRFRNDRTGQISVSKGYSLAILTDKRPSYNSASYHTMSLQAQNHAVAQYEKGNYGMEIIGIDDEYFIDW